MYNVKSLDPFLLCWSVGQSVWLKITKEMCTFLGQFGWFAERRLDIFWREPQWPERGLKLFSVDNEKDSAILGHGFSKSHWLERLENTVHVVQRWLTIKRCWKFNKIRGTSKGVYRCREKSTSDLMVILTQYLVSVEHRPFDDSSTVGHHFRFNTHFSVVTLSHRLAFYNKYFKKRLGR